MIEIFDTEFKDSFYDSALMSLSYSQMNMNNIAVSRSYGKFKTNGIILINAYMDATNLTVNNRPLTTTPLEHLTIVDFGFFNLLQGSSLKLYDSNFTQVVG
jgi:hypothetical protein